MAQVDNYQASANVQTTARRVEAVTPSDVTPLAEVPKALYIGSTGNVVLRPVDSAADVTYFNVPAGQYLLVQASFVRATGTTASGILAHLK